MKNKIIILGLILGLATALRLYKLDSIPPSPYWEETALGYDAYSIAKTGKDFHGNPYPILAFPSFGDYKPSGYFYAEVPFVKLLGLNLWAVRLPAALAGVVTVVMMYLIGKELWDERVGFTAAALFAVSPWSLQFSRGGWEVNLAVMCVAVGSWLLLRARRYPMVLPVSVLFFGYSMYTYHAARVYAPLVGALGGLLLLRAWLPLRAKKIMILVLSLCLALGFTLPFVLNLKSSSVSSRFDDTTIFSNPAPVLQSNQQIALHGNTRLAKLMYHRYWYYGDIIAQGFVAHFNPSFLFVRGDGLLRHSTVAFGLLFPLDAAFIVIALIMMVVRRDAKVLLLVICVLLAGIAPALVTPTPHALRFLFAAPALYLLSAYGIAQLTRARRLRHLSLVGVLVVIIYLGFVGAYLQYYYTQYPIKAAADWQYGYQQMYTAVASLKRPGETVYVTREQGRPSMYYLFYTAYDPATIQAQGSQLPKDQLELLQVGDYHFVDQLPMTAGLYATSLSKVDPHAQVLTQIKSLDGSVVWVIWRR